MGGLGCEESPLCYAGSCLPRVAPRSDISLSHGTPTRHYATFDAIRLELTRHPLFFPPSAPFRFSLSRSHSSSSIQILDREARVSPSFFRKRKRENCFFEILDARNEYLCIFGTKILCVFKD